MSQPPPLPDDASPCTGVCRLDPDEVCIGCGRYIVEIAGWGAATVEQRRAWRRLALNRLAEVPARPPSTS